MTSIQKEEPSHDFDNSYNDDENDDENNDDDDDDDVINGFILPSINMELIARLEKNIYVFKNQYSELSREHELLQEQVEANEKEIVEFPIERVLREIKEHLMSIAILTKNIKTIHQKQKLRAKLRNCPVTLGNVATQKFENEIKIFEDKIKIAGREIETIALNQDLDLVKPQKINNEQEQIYLGNKCHELKEQIDESYRLIKEEEMRNAYIKYGCDNGLLIINEQKDIDNVNNNCDVLHNLVIECNNYHQECLLRNWRADITHSGGDYRNYIWSNCGYIDIIDILKFNIAHNKPLGRVFYKIGTYSNGLLRTTKNG